MWLAILILGVLAFFCLPLIPMILGVFKKTDTEPLVIPFNMPEFYSLAAEMIEDEIVVNEHYNTKDSLIAKKFILFDFSGKFKMLDSPKIGFGIDKTQFNDETIEENEKKYRIDSSPKSCEIPQRKIIESDLIVSEGDVLFGEYVVKGKIIFSANSKIKGNFSGYQDIVVEENVLLEGSLFGKKNISIGSNSRIKGPIVAKENLFISEKCVFGLPSAETTIVADNINVSSGVIIYGAVIAQQQGNFNINEVHANDKES